jgi:hypothetical protein
MAACRVYLGVHWATDALAGLVWGVVYLALVGMVFDQHHIGRCGIEVAATTDRDNDEDDRELVGSGVGMSGLGVSEPSTTG